MLTLAAALVGGTFGADVAYRFAVPLGPGEDLRLENFRRMVRGEAAAYRPLPHTAYGLNPEREGVNSLGFRGPEWKRERTPGVPRILCLGASTTEGGNSGGWEGSYPGLLERGVKEALGGPVEIFNAGVSGWTTAETLAAWFLTLRDFQPDVVVLHHALSDVMPRNAHDFEPDYRHWRIALRRPRLERWQELLVPWSDYVARQLMVQEEATLRVLTTRATVGPTPFKLGGGSLPAETAHPFERNILSIGRDAASIGATVCLMTVPLRPVGDGPDPFPSFRFGTGQHNEILRRLSAEHRWLLVDLERAFPARLGDLHEQAFLDYVHVTPSANALKAELLFQRLALAWFPDWKASNR